MKLYWEIGRPVCERPEKGAAPTPAENIDQRIHNKDIALDTEEDPCYTEFEEKHL